MAADGTVHRLNKCADDVRNHIRDRISKQRYADLEGGNEYASNRFCSTGWEYRKNC